MYLLTENDLPALCLGATMLGSGGGGEIAPMAHLVKSLLVKHGPISVVQATALSPDTLVVPVALVGAPLKEQALNTAMFTALIRAIKQHFPAQPIALLPAEIGGSNALAPFMAAARLGLPVVDGDLIGRAFPKVDMAKPAVLGHLPSIAYIASNQAGVVKTFRPNSFADLERQARQISIEFGGYGAIAVYLFTAASYQDFLIENTLSQAINLGKQFINTKPDLAAFCRHTGATLLTEGKLQAVSQTVSQGFLVGSACISNATTSMSVHFQNEYLSVQSQGVIIAQSPDIFVILNLIEQTPLASAALQDGLPVALLSLPAPDFWLSPTASATLALALTSSPTETEHIP